MSGGCAPIRCATYRVTITNRVTNNLSIDCPDLVNRVDALKFGWTRNTTSTCDLTIPLTDDATGAACCDCKVKPWRDLVTVERVSPDGTLEGVAWQGPVTRFTEDYERGTLTVFASDWSIDAARRPEARTTITGEMDEARLWYELFKDALAGGFGALIPTMWTPTGKTVKADIKAGTAAAAGTTSTPYLTGDTLSSVVWCVIGRTLHGPGPTIDGDRTWGTLHTSEAWDGRPVIEEDGTTVASQYRCRAKTADNKDLIGVYPAVPVEDPELGLHIIPIDLADTTWTQTTITAEAKARWQAHQHPERFIVTNSASLSESCPVCFWELVPGRRFDVVTDDTCTKLTEPVTLFNLTVDAAPDADGLLRETRVAVDFSKANSLSLPLDLLSV